MLTVFFPGLGVRAFEISSLDVSYKSHKKHNSNNNSLNRPDASRFDNYLRDKEKNVLAFGLGPGNGHEV